MNPKCAFSLVPFLLFSDNENALEVLTKRCQMRNLWLNGD